MEIQSRPLNKSSLGVFFSSIFIIYTVFISEVRLINPVLYATAIGTVGVVLIYMSGIPLQPQRDLTSFSRMLFIFSVYALLSGIIVSKYKGDFISGMVTFIAFAVMCVCVDYISTRRGSIQWVIEVIKITAVLSAIYALSFGVQVRTESVWVLVLSPANNPNTLGFTMVIGIFATVFNKEKMKRHLMLNIVFIGLMLYVIVQCGSRKCLISGAVLLVLWLYNFLWSEKQRSMKATFSRIVIMVACIVVVYYLKNGFLSTSSFEKIIHTIDTGQGAISRINLFKVAFDLLKEHPLFGVGFRQFQLVSEMGKYSHMAYAELLSCTGIIGTVIFLFPIGRLFVLLCKKNRNQRDYYYRMLLAMLLIELILGVGMIFMYFVGHLLIFTILFWSTEHGFYNEMEVE